MDNEFDIAVVAAISQMISQDGLKLSEIPKAPSAGGDWTSWRAFSERLKKKLGHMGYGYLVDDAPRISAGSYGPSNAPEYYDWLDNTFSPSVQRAIAESGYQSSYSEWNPFDYPPGESGPEGGSGDGVVTDGVVTEGVVTDGVEGNRGTEIWLTDNATNRALVDTWGIPYRHEIKRDGLSDLTVPYLVVDMAQAGARDWSDAVNIALKAIADAPFDTETKSAMAIGLNFADFALMDAQTRNAVITASNGLLIPNDDGSFSLNPEMSDHVLRQSQVSAGGGVINPDGSINTQFSDYLQGQNLITSSGGLVGADGALTQLAAHERGNQFINASGGVLNNEGQLNPAFANWRTGQNYIDSSNGWLTEHGHLNPFMAHANLANTRIGASGGLYDQDAIYYTQLQRMFANDPVIGYLWMLDNPPPAIDERYLDDMDRYGVIDLWDTMTQDEKFRDKFGVDRATMQQLESEGWSFDHILGEFVNPDAGVSFDSLGGTGWRISDPAVAAAYDRYSQPANYWEETSPKEGVTLGNLDVLAQMAQDEGVLGSRGMIRGFREPRGPSEVGYLGPDYNARIDKLHGGIGGGNLGPIADTESGSTGSTMLDTMGQIFRQNTMDTVGVSTVEDLEAAQRADIAARDARRAAGLSATNEQALREQFGENWMDAMPPDVKAKLGL